MPFPDEPDDAPEDGPGFGSPLPPEDRLWRHPSELAAERSSASRPAPSAPVAPPTAAPGAAVRPRSWAIGLASASVGVAATLVVLALFGTFDGPGTRTVVEQVEVAAPISASTDAAVADAVGGAVVRIDVQRGGATTSAAGVVFRSDGHVLTTADAVAGAEAITVTTDEGLVLGAELVGADPTSDVAVVHVDADDLPTAVLGRVDDLAAGEDALGVVPGLDPASSPQVLAGTVASTGTRVDLPDGEALHDMITATLGAGTVVPGGALCTDDGAVVGLLTTRSQPVADTTELVEPATTTVALDPASPHYATPIDYATSVADQLIATGAAQHTWMGVQGEDLDAGTAAHLGRAGAAITRVVTGGPADQAGIRPGDVILAVDGVQVTSISSLVVALRDHADGDQVPVTVVRDDTQRLVVVTLTSRS